MSRKTVHDKNIVEFIGLSREECRELIFSKFAQGASEDSSIITFCYRKWRYTIFFENNFCNHASAKSMK